MKKLTLALVLLFAGVVSFAQQNGDWKEDLELRLTVGGSPITASEYFTDGHIIRGYYDFDYYSSQQLSSLYKDYRGPIKTIGAIGLNAQIKVTKKSKVGIDLYFNSLWYDTYNGITDAKTGREGGASLYLMPNYKWYYLNRDFLKIYMGASAGVGKYFGYDNLKGWRTNYEGQKYWIDESFKFETQITPLGFEIGRGDWYGIAEFGFGTIYCGMSVGVGYRF